MESQEKTELNLLLQKGVSLELEYKEIISPRLWQFWKRKKTEIKKITLVFREPTLAVLDRVSLEIQNLDFDEKRLMSENVDVVMREGKRIAFKAIKPLARIIAIFALREKLFIRQNRTYIEDTAALDKLTQIIIYALEPSKIEQLISCLTSLSNIAGFLNSIRLLAALRTTQSRIE